MVKVPDPLSKFWADGESAASAVVVVVAVFDVLPLSVNESAASAPAAVLSALEEAEAGRSGVPGLARPSSVVICASRVIHPLSSTKTSQVCEREERVITVATNLPTRERGRKPASILAAHPFRSQAERLIKRTAALCGQGMDMLYQETLLSLTCGGSASYCTYRFAWCTLSL